MVCVLRCHTSSSYADMEESSPGQLTIWLVLSLVTGPPRLGCMVHSSPRPQQTSLQPRRDHWLDRTLEPTPLHSWQGYMPGHSPQTPGLLQCTGRLPLLPRPRIVPPASQGQDLLPGPGSNHTTLPQ